jgi:hypothetical protein
MKQRCREFQHEVSMKTTVGEGGPELTPNHLAILLGLRGRSANSPKRAVSKYVLMREDGVGPRCGNMAELSPPLIEWVEQPTSPVPKITKSKWTLWITKAGLKAITNHILVTGRKQDDDSK